METTDQNFETGYSPAPNGFLHTCPECPKVFYGRKNKIFCCPEHKANANNRKAAERKARVGHQGLILEKNVEIIYEFCKGKSTPYKVEISQLINLGFIIDGPSVLHKPSDDTYWSQIGNYVLGKEKSSGLIAIMTEEEFKKL